jgi:hypothetical protein
VATETVSSPAAADRAAYHEGAERGFSRVADAYLKERPEEGRRWEKYVEARTKAELPAAHSLQEVVAQAVDGGYGIVHRVLPVREG